jgi:hypothetical protein
MGIELDARLALAEIEIKAGQTAAGGASLTEIESDAQAKGSSPVRLPPHAADALLSRPEGINLPP